MEKNENQHENVNEFEKIYEDFARDINKRRAKQGKRKINFVRGFKIFFKTLLLLFTAGLLTSVIIFLGVYVKYSNEFENITPESKSTQLTFYDKNGDETFRDYGAAEPIKLSLSEIPENVKKATLAAEDLDFYKHGPIDLKGIVRAGVLNWRDSNKTGLERIKDMLNESSYTQGGGSTITQQLVKNIYLTPEKSFTRKIKEVVFSYKLEQKYSKDQIFEMYLNQIYYGAQSLGIENAAQAYFGKSAKDLDLAEASMLAGLPQAPSYYSPFANNFDASKKRQEYVLQKMYLANYISLDEAKQAANEALVFSENNTNQVLNKFPFFNQYIKEELISLLGSDQIESKGLKVYTSIDPEKQIIAENAIKDQMKKLANRGATNASAVVADPKTNEILAMVGGVDWNTSKVNVATSLRQPGSSFKPIVYASALENGYTAATILNDKRVNFGGSPAYVPQNYDGKFRGYVTIRNALAQSLNIPAVEMGKMVGLSNVVDTAKDLGITSLNEKPESYGLPLSLGSGEVKLLDMMQVYSTFADGGKRMPQTGIKKILDQRNNEVPTIKRNKQQVISQETAYIISSILSDNNARTPTFGSNSPLKTEKITAVKTGTTDNYSDSWTMGFSPDLVVGVWMGNNDRKPMKKVSGVEGAAYIWHDIITGCLKNSPNKEFVKPDSIKEAWISPSTGTIAKFNGKPNILEYFKAGTEPKDKVDLSYLKQF